MARLGDTFDRYVVFGNKGGNRQYLTTVRADVERNPIGAMKAGRLNLTKEEASAYDSFEYAIEVFTKTRAGWTQTRFVDKGF